MGIGCYLIFFKFWPLSLEKSRMAPKKTDKYRKFFSSRVQVVDNKEEIIMSCTLKKKEPNLDNDDDSDEEYILVDCDFETVIMK